MQDSQTEALELQRRQNLTSLPVCSDPAMMKIVNLDESKFDKHQKNSNPELIDATQK